MEAQLLSKRAGCYEESMAGPIHFYFLPMPNQIASASTTVTDWHFQEKQPQVVPLKPLPQILTDVHLQATAPCVKLQSRVPCNVVLCRRLQGACRDPGSLPWGAPWAFRTSAESQIQHKTKGASVSSSKRTLKACHCKRYE